MPSLVDIAPITEQVTVRGVEFECRGISLEVFAQILADSLDLQKALGNVSSFEPMQLLHDAPVAVSKLIAAGLGHKGNREEERAARENLTLGEQAQIVERLIALTFPGGLNPFVELVTRMFGEVDVAGAASGRAPLGNSRSPPIN